MVHLGRRKGDEIRVTGIASRVGRQMGSRLVQCQSSIVACSTRACRHTAMVIGRRLPCHRAVAFVTGTGSRRDVVGRTYLGIHRGIAAVVTAKTVSSCSRVAHRRW